VDSERGEWRRRIWVTIAWTFFGSVLGQVASAAILYMSGVNLAAGGLDYAALSPLTLAGMIGASQMLGFLVPAVIAGYTLYKQNWWRELRLLPAPTILQLAVGVLILLSSVMLVSVLAQLNASYELAGWQIEMEESVAAALERIITAEGPLAFAGALLLIGVLPALGEELVFRGLLQPGFVRLTGSAQAGIWITAILFGLIHFQFAGILPRIALGAVLGGLAYYSQRLWVPIFAHFLFNGAQVVAVRLGFQDAQSPTDLELSAPDPMLTAAALAVAAAGMWLYKYLVPAEHPRPPLLEQEDAPPEQVV